MGGLLLAHAFAHHTWATLRLLDACAALAPEQLASAAPGTYGSILDTLRHLVDADATYLAFLSRDDRLRVSTDAMGLAELREVTERNDEGWTALLAGDLDADEIVGGRWQSGWETRAPVGVRLAQALHHGTDHRSQVCTALSVAGIEPPPIDAWDYAEAAGCFSHTPPPTGWGEAAGA